MSRLTPLVPRAKVVETGGKTLNLTSFERLILSMQLRQLHEQEPKVGYDTQAEIVERGYTTLYSDVFGTTGEPELSREVQEEVFDILNMFRAMHPGHAAGVGWNPSGDDYYQKFRGFDGNDSEGHFGFARFLIKQNRRFEESDGELNSHGPSLNVYRPMLERWQDMGRPHQMSQQQISEVLGN